ncbi:MAG: TetR family transcriptional regulator [Flavobacteriaceae bacterium]|nr:TetR family transcriptional regulator [Flavobacteriaceae bacterium]MBN10501.1 TetR family transcriptional regulator [Flavobacteriaceae bacterium]
MEKSIVVTSTELFLTLGFKSVTMDDIAEEMKISKKTIYTFFANKEALVQSVVFSMYSYITTNLTQIREKASNPISELYEVKMFIMHQLKGEKTSPQHQLRKYYPNIHKELQKKQFDFMTKSVKKSLTKGVEMKLFRPSIDIDFISRMYFNGMVGIKNVDMFPIEKYSPEQLMENYLDYHLRAIVTDNGMKLLSSYIKTKS